MPAQLNAKDAHYSTTFRRITRSTSTGSAVKVLPLNRAKFQVGAKFDLRIEATGVDPETTKIVIKVSDGGGPAPLLGPAPLRTSSAPDSVEVTYKDLVYPAEGDYTIAAAVSSSAGFASQEVKHEVVLADDRRARPPRTSSSSSVTAWARPPSPAPAILSKGITEGKYDALLEMDTARPPRERHHLRLATPSPPTPRTPCPRT